MYLNNGLTEDFTLIQITLAILEKEKFTTRKYETSPIGLNFRDRTCEKIKWSTKINKLEFRF